MVPTGSTGLMSLGLDYKVLGAALKRKARGFFASTEMSLQLLGVLVRMLHGTRFAHDGTVDLALGRTGGFDESLGPLRVKQDKLSGGD